MKTCSKCKAVKKLADYHVRSDRPDGRQTICKSCVSERSKKKYGGDTNADKRARIEKNKAARARKAELYKEGMKECLGCLTIKTLSSFPANKTKPDGVQSQCRACKASADRVHYEENAEKIRERSRLYLEKNREQINERARENYRANRSEILRKANKWRAENKDLVREKNRRSYRKNKAKVAEKNKKWAKDNRELARANHKRWRENNAAHVREKARESFKVWYRKKRKDPLFRLSVVMRVTLRRQINRIGGSKDSTTSEALGYSPSDLASHLERQFCKGMTWDNYGEWHIDHIIPVAEHIKRGETDPSVINCLSNLRPLWARDNQEKSASVAHLI